jgi:ABC-type lipoprotein export system ATPase subunit
MSEPLLRATGLRKTYRIGSRLVEVLRGVDLTVEPGEFVALRGASGAGKSTLLHLLGGLDRPNHGEIKFRGQSHAALTDNELAKLRVAHVGHIFQAYHLLPELDAVENVALPARVARMDVAEAEKRARELLRRVGLEHRLEHRPTELSGGEQQRVAIARALVNQPLLILADEPTGNLDSQTGEEILNLLCELRTERNATLVIATHDSRVATRAPRVVELVDGALK